MEVPHMSQPSANALQLVITFDPMTMKVELGGNCIDQKLLTLGMLDIAHHEIHKYHDRLAEGKENRIVTPVFGALPGNGRAGS